MTLSALVSGAEVTPNGSSSCISSSEDWRNQAIAFLTEVAGTNEKVHAQIATSAS